MEVIKKILIRILALLLIAVVSKAVYSKWFYEGDIEKYSEIYNLIRAIPNDADIIYMAESSNNTSRKDDKDKRKISDFVGDYYPDLNTYEITKPASHAGIYKVLLENIPEENTVQTVVVTLNLRSFNAQWIYSILETPLQKSIVLLKDYPPLVNRFLLSFKAYDGKTEKERRQQIRAKWKRDKFDMPDGFKFKDVIEWNLWMFSTGLKNNNGKKDFKKTELACHYIKTYGFQIDVLKNPRIKDFDDIVDLANKKDWNLVFNLLADNIEMADELVGDDLVYMMNQNAKLLIDYYESKGVKVIDNFTVVESEQFINQNWTTEHYAEKGRKIIAKNVATGIKEWHLNEFKEIEIK